MSTVPLETVLERGLTRDDLLFLGELVDVTPLARSYGWRCPVAFSRAVTDAAETFTHRVGLSLPNAYYLVLRPAARLLNTFIAPDGALRLGTSNPFRVDGLDCDLSLHVAKADPETFGPALLATVYTSAEVPAYV